MTTTEKESLAQTYHARHTDGGTTPAREQQRVVFCTKDLVGVLLDVRESLPDHVPDFDGKVVVLVVEEPAQGSH